MLFPLCLVSQSSNDVQALLKSKMTTQTSIAYYLKNTNLSRHFINRYIDLTKSFKKHDFFKAKKYKGYRSEDTLMAYKQIKRLNEAGQNAKHQLMRTRLEWDYKEHLQKTLLDSAMLKLRNYSDSASYFFTLGIYCKDSINEVIARRFGYVKSDNKGNELVDWEKMNNFKFDGWVISDLSALPPTIDISIGDIRNSFILYFEKAIELDKKEFYYMIEMLVALIRLGDEETVQKKITEYKNGYSINEQKWLTERMNESIARQQKQKTGKLIEMIR